ncbi:MAG: hypothetical protein WC453_00410 [Patescibacteria group bacterium]
MKSSSRNRILMCTFSFLVAIGIFLIGRPALADWPTEIMSGLLSIFIWALGVILGLVLQVLILIAGYQDFINSQAVVLGWVIVRDICNMFFVIVLMIIAFGTILHLENYSYKKWLPKLILMAVLINFSKTICGILIDITQVAMLTFVNAFKDIGGGNATEMLGIAKIVTLSQTSNDTGFFTVVGAYILGMIYLIVSIIVIVAMMMMLVMRLVMIWIYVVLSPAAYLLSAFPGGQKYASQWWSEFIKNLIVGPVLAFFIWLSLASLGATSPSFDTTAADKNLADYNTQITTSAQSAKLTTGGEQSDAATAGTEASKPSVLIKFIIAIGMLLGGMMVTQQIGGAAGSMAGKVFEKGKGLSLKGAKGLGKWAGRRLADVRDIASEKAGVDLNLAAVWRRRNEQSEANRQLRLMHIRKNTLATAAGDKNAEGQRPGWLHRKLALASTGDVAWQNIVDKKFGVLTAGDVNVAEQAMTDIKKVEDDKNKAGENIESIRGESERTITQAEHVDNVQKAKNLRTANQELADRKKEITDSADYKTLKEKEDKYQITDSEQKSLDKYKEQIKKIDEKTATNEEDIERLDPGAITFDQVQANRANINSLELDNAALEDKKQKFIEKESYQNLLREESSGQISPANQALLDTQRNYVKSLDDRIKVNNEKKDKLSKTTVVVKDEAAKKEAQNSFKREIISQENNIKQYDKQLDGLNKALRHNQLSELSTARGHVDAQAEGEAAKKIATFVNPDQLVGIFKEAVESKDQALMAAVYKKLAKTANYNELHKALNIGTGYDGMIEMSKRLQTKEGGGMNEQDARGLVAEVGEICKGIGHMEAFASMSMNKAGQWEETGKDQQEAAILSEKSKIQVQQFVRNINRLGAGSYENDKPHTADNWTLSRSTLALFAAKDAKYADEMSKTGNINTIQFIGSNPKNLQALKDAGAKEVAKVIEDVMRKARVTSANVAKPLDSIRAVSRS